MERKQRYLCKEQMELKKVQRFTFSMNRIVESFSWIRARLLGKRNYCFGIVALYRGSKKTNFGLGKHYKGWLERHTKNSSWSLEKYHFYCADHYEAYKSLISSKKFFLGKNKTVAIERNNSLARFKWKSFLSPLKWSTYQLAYLHLSTTSFFGIAN